MRGGNVSRYTIPDEYDDAQRFFKTVYHEQIDRDELANSELAEIATF
jgi:hypothetical protein